MSRELITKVNQIIKKTKIPQRHSEFQIKNFIIGKEPTCQSKLWQICKEIKGRKETLDALSKQMDDSVDNLELLDIRIKRQQLLIKKQELTKNDSVNSDDIDNYELNIQEAKINIKKAEREKKALSDSISELEDRATATMEELRVFIAAFDSLEKIEPMKPFDDEEAQNEYWNKKLLEEFNIRALFNQTPDTELIKTILSLGDDSKVRNHVESLIVQRRSMIENMNKQKRPEVKAEARIQGK